MRYHSALLETYSLGQRSNTPHPAFTPRPPPPPPGPNVAFANPLTALPGCVAAAKAAGATIIIALTHVGAALDVTLASTPGLSDVDLIIGGHSHTLFYTGTPPPLLVTPATPESTPVYGPYPLNVANGNKTIPVVQALWASRWARRRKPGTAGRAQGSVVARCSCRRLCRRFCCGCCSPAGCVCRTLAAPSGLHRPSPLQNPSQPRYLGQLDTVWSAAGDLLNATGRPLLLGGDNSTNPVASDAAAVARLDSLRGPVDALNLAIVGEGGCLPCDAMHPGSAASKRGCTMLPSSPHPVTDAWVAPDTPLPLQAAPASS